MKNKDLLLQLITPSWLVNFSGISIGVLTTAAMIFFAKFQSSVLRFQIYDVQSRSLVAKQQSVYGNITSGANNSTFLGSLPLLVTWACIGLLVYYFAVALIQAFGRVAALHDEVNYVHASRRNIIRSALMSMGIRVLATIGWFLFITLSIRVLVPYALASATAAATSWSLQSLAYALLAIIVIYVDVLVHAIFLRLVLLRPRVLGG